MYLNFLKFEDYFDDEKVLTSSNPLKDKKFDENGIFSEKIFGSNEDPNTLSFMGWISFGNYYIINPILTNRMKKVFKNKIFDKLINYEQSIDKDGMTISNKNKYENIGLIEFKERFLEILENIGNKNIPEYNTLKRLYDEDKIFINCMPVFTNKLRPGMIIDNVLFFNDINKNYNLLIKYSNDINDIDIDSSNDEDIKSIILSILYKMQKSANNIVYSIINDFLKGKKGYFRKIIMGTRICYSARSVIIPAPDGEMENVKLPYLTFLELYKFPILNLMSKCENISFNQAYKYFNDSLTHFDNKIYSYCTELLNKTKDGIKIILNRNPTINIGSLFMLNVSEIKKDYNDLTLSLSNNILVPLNADFDGDVLNIFMLFDSDSKKSFKKLTPENFIISNNNGKFNRDFTIQKEQRLSVFILNN